MSKKGTRALASATLMSLVLTSALSAGQVKAAAGQVTRVGEADRYATAAKVATSNWTTSDDVVLVSGEGYADAVSASALAKKLNAPILLTTAGSLNTDAKAALSTLKAKNIYIVGGNASVNSSVRSDLAANYKLVELQGANRYETNVAVAKKLVELGVKADNVLLVGGEGFSDALSVAPVAAAKGQILLLGNNNADSMKSVVDFVKTNNSKVTVVGTKNVISEDILTSLGSGATRVDGGSDRFDTNLKVLNSFKSDLKVDKLYVANASGNGYADALVASALAGKTASPLVLVDTEGTSATNNAVSYIKTNANVKTDLNVVGGTGVVSNGTVDAINKAVNPQGQGGATTVQSIEAVSLNQIKVHFNCNIDSDSAEDETNYKIDGTQLKPGDANDKATDENGAVATAIDDNTVLITLAHPRKQYDDVTVSVKKAVLTADKENTVDAFDQTVTFSDTTVPTLKKVTVEGNSQLTVEFSEAVNMKTINELKSKFKIDGQSIGNYGVNSTWSEIKDHIEVANSSYGTVGTWSNKVLFYFDSPVASGNHTLKISDGDNNNGLLSDAAGFTFKEASEDFTVDSMSTKPVIKSVQETSSGEVHITFDRPMDVQTAKDEAYYEINGKKMSEISGAEAKTATNDTVIKLKHIGSAIKSGSNTLYIKNNVKDAFGNKVADDTRVNFDDVKDETKPTVKNISVIDSETIRVKFSKDVDNSYARNISNYKLQDNKDIDITNHIDHISSTIGENDTDDTDTYNIKLKKFNPNNSNDDWRLTAAKYTLTIKNIVDTASTPNTMEDYTYTINGNDDIAPKGTGIYAKLHDSSSTKDKVVVYFSESMDTSTLTNKDNFKFVNGEGDTKSLPGDASISAGGDNKSAIIEFPSSYHVKINTKTTTGTTNDVTAVIVSNVKDEAGNILDGVAYNNNKVIDEAKAGAKVKDKTLKVRYDGDDLKVDVQFDKAVSEIVASDFTLGGIAPTSANISGDKVTLTFKDGAKPTTGDVVTPITYANGMTKTDASKIDLVKAQGQGAKLAITSTGTIDETGAKISRNDDGSVASLSTDQATVYDYQAAPKTTGDDDKAPYWSATADANGGKVYVTFDTVLDENSGVKSDDFTFSGKNGTDIKADSVKVTGNTVIFSFNTNNKDYSSFTGSLDVRAKSTVSLRTVKDLDGKNANFAPSSDDLKKRTVTISGNPTPNPVVGTVDLSSVTYNNPVDNFSTVVTFKLTVAAGDSASNYNVTVKGVNATLTNGTFAATVDGKVTAVTALDFVVTKKTTTTAAVDTATIACANPVDNFSTIVTFKLNVADQTGYAVTVKGVSATLTNGTFAATVDGKVAATDLKASDFVVTTK